MAIQKTINLIDNFGVSVEFKDAYIKVDRIDANKICGTAYIYIFHGTSKKELKRDIQEFNVDLSGSNFIRQAYEHIKTLPDYTDAIDC